MTTQINRPRRILITRSKEGNDELVGMLRGSGFETITVDTISFHPPADWSEVDGRLKRLHEFDWLVFTSRVGVKFFIARMKLLRLGTAWRDRPAVAAVGPRTSDALENAGIGVDFTPSEYLTKKLAAELPRDRGKRLLLLRSDRSHGMLRRTLQRRGFEVDEQRIYQTRAVILSDGLDLNSLDVIIFGSPSEVGGLCNQITRETLDSLMMTPVLCIGPVTARAAKRRGFKRITIPTTYTFDSVVRRLGRLIADA